MAGQVQLSDTMQRQNVLVQRLGSGEAKKFERFLREIDKELRARLAADSLTSMDKARLERLIAGVDDMLKGVFDRFTRQLVVDLVAFAEHEAAITAKALLAANVTAKEFYAEGALQEFLKSVGALEEHISENTVWEFVATDKGKAVLQIRPVWGAAKPAAAIDVLVAEGRGSGRAAMERMTRFADHYGVELRLQAVPLHGGADTPDSPLFQLSQKRLEEWYKSHGFRVVSRDSEGYPDMLRTPVAPAAKTTADALVITTPFESVIPSLAQVRAAILTDPLAVTGPDGGSLLEPFLANWTAAERKAVTGAIRLGVFQGKTNQQLVQTLRGTRAAGYADGLLATTTRHAEAVVRTAVQHVSTAARAETMRVNADIVAKVQWLSTLDKRTCPRCGALDGMVFPVKKGPRPPLHPNCRCTTVPVLADEWAGLDAGMKRPAVGARGPGQVLATESYYEWLRRQPAEFQNEAIGVGRATLMRKGGLSAGRFAALQMDKHFAPLTLDEMRALEPLAFRRAGL